MNLTADYHTHTKYSHGKGTILDNALLAKDIGLKQLGISDHGFSHPAFGLRQRYLEKMKKECCEATEKTGVKVLLGIESNVISEEGKVDLQPKNYQHFDIFLAGIHKFIFFNVKSAFKLFIPDIIKSYKNNPKVPQKLIDRNTNAFINVIKNNPVDVITHLNFCCFADAFEVAKVAADYGTYLELNAKKVHLTDKELEKVLKTDVRFVISSDAHSPNRVGEIELVKEMLNRLNFPLDRIDNIDGRLPNFRFANYKEKNL